MGSFRNNRRRKKRSGADILDAELVPLTDGLILSLSRRWGCSAEEIRQQKDQYGVMYCPARDSLMTQWRLA